MRYSRSGSDLSLSTEGKALETTIECYNDLVSLYKLKGGRKAIQQTKRWAAALSQIEESDSFLSTLKLYYDQMIKELGGHLPPLSGEPKDEGPRIARNTLNDQRSAALKEYLETTDKQSLKSSEAKIVLESIENKKLSRCQVLRSLKNLPKIVYGVCDKVGARCEIRFVMNKSPIRNTADYSRLIRLGS